MTRARRAEDWDLDLANAREAEAEFAAILGSDGRHSRVALKDRAHGVSPSRFQIDVAREHQHVLTACGRHAACDGDAEARR